MKCADCSGSLMPRGAVRLRAVSMAQCIATEKQPPQQRAALATFGLLLAGELCTRCESCATARLMSGVSAILATETAAPDAG